MSTNRRDFIRQISVIATAVANGPMNIAEKMLETLASQTAVRPDLWLGAHSLGYSPIAHFLYSPEEIASAEHGLALLLKQNSSLLQQALEKRGRLIRLAAEILHEGEKALDEPRQAVNREASIARLNKRALDIDQDLTLEQRVSNWRNKLDQQAVEFAAKEAAKPKSPSLKEAKEKTRQWLVEDTARQNRPHYDDEGLYKWQAKQDTDLKDERHDGKPKAPRER